MTPRPKARIAREYLRVSFDRSGRQKSNDEQHADNAAAAPALGIDRFGKPYRDTGSASRHARRERDDFARLLDDLSAGRFGADVLVLWESSRGSRKVGEWVDLIERCEKAGVRIAVSTHGRLYDPANPRDRRTLLEDAVDGEYESAKTSLRATRAAAASAAEGQPYGPLLFGYRRTYDPITRRLVAQELDPAESPIVVELFDRLAAGHSLTSISKDFAARGIVSRRGNPMAPQTLRLMALNPAYIKRRVHSRNRPPGAYTGDPEASYDAVWPRIVSDDVFYAVKARLKDPARTTRRPGRGKHLLSITARCHHCDGPLVATFRFAGVRRYQCQSGGHVLIGADALDAWAEGEMLRALTRPDVLERLMPHGVNDDTMAAARDEVARVRNEHADLVAQVGSGKLSATLAAGAEPPILARLHLAEKHVEELATPAGLRQLIDPGPAVADQWKVMPMAAKREVARLLFVPNVLGALAVARVNGGGNTVEARVRLDGQPLPS
jgi:DNA invertase Pin-like site-specific DNA recombinase